MRRTSLASILLALAVPACGSPDPGPTDAGTPDAGPRNLLETVPETARVVLPTLGHEAIVIRTENDVPHVYAADHEDAMRVLGYVMAVDRYFQMELTKRLSEGNISELLGDVALEIDVEQRMQGSAHLTDLQLSLLTDQEAAELDAFVDGINAYIDDVGARRADPPSELKIAFPLLGASKPVDLMHHWTRRDAVATGVTALYATSFETGDVGRDRDLARVDDIIAADAPDRALRVAGLQADVMDRYAPPNDSTSASGWGLETSETASAPIPDRTHPIRTARGGAPHVERETIARLERTLQRADARRHSNEVEGYGSNSWAVAGGSTNNGHSLLAGDGHLDLSVPALFWQFGLDTKFLGEEEDPLTLLGSTIAGVPLMGTGTNGRVAWTQTAYFADVTDWYAEEIILDDDGMPTATRFGTDEERPLESVVETYVIADVEQLDSVGRTLELPRFTTYDGRFVTAIEGREVEEDTVLAAGESRLNVNGKWIVPGDTDGDGVVTGVSFDYGPFDGGVLLRAFRAFAHSDDVEEYRQAMRHFIGYGGSMMASDSHGDVLYSAYHAVPTRDYLPRDAENHWIEGADPRRLLDGTRYGGWELPITADGTVDEAACNAGAPEKCAVPFDQWPQALSPLRGYVHHANNDPGAVATDGDLFDDPYYIGGPWIEGYRAERIEQRLREEIDADGATFEDMQAIQGDHHSVLGEEWVSVLLEEIAYARGQAAGTPAAGSSDERIAAIYEAEQAAIDDVETRLENWRDAGFPTPSGVETFYHPDVDAAELESAVATTIFHNWFARVASDVMGDEGIPGSLSPAVTGDTFRMQTIKLLFGNRGENPDTLGSWDPVREESVFFDDVGTTALVETSHEIVMRSLQRAFAFLRSAPDPETHEGGYGSSDPTTWIWGLRHGVRFTSLVGSELGGEGSDPLLDGLLSMFNTTPKQLPLAEDIEEGDPRFGLTFFPRPGDQFDIDAANPGFSGTRFTHGAGPVFRMVIELGPDFVRGANILPGGQSGVLENARYFDDQAELWLGNQTQPMRFTPEEVVAGAIARQVFVPE